jgi:hypothetical protein
MRSIGLAALAVLPIAAFAADDLRIEQLKQDIAELHRLLREYDRRIDQLEQQRFRAPTQLPGRSADAPAGAPPGSDKWLTPANWDKVRPGMSEQQVLEVLGYPTSVRQTETDGAKTLFYTMQVGPSGFLSGRVVIAGDAVREVERPVLR